MAESDFIWAVIDSCRVTYGPDRLRVIKDQGDYKYILRLKFIDDVWAQFAVPVDQDLMDVFLSGDSVSIDLRQDFNRAIADVKTVDQLGECLESAEQWWTAVAEQFSSTNTKSNRRKRTKKDKSHQNQPDNIDEPSAGQGMKPAQDVISRILWDPTLPQDNFVVGYLDRFVGVVEKPFNVFSWENFDKVDPETAAIPRHRIQYFKYKTAKVWDKRERLDLMFGSTGTGGKSMEAVIEKENKKDGTFVSSDESEPEEQMPVSLEGSSTTGLEDTAVDQQPDYYLSIPVRSPELITRLEAIQDSLRSYCPKAVKKFVGKNGFHITLCLFCSHELGEFGVQRLSRAISDQAAVFDSLLKDANIQFRGPVLYRQYKVVVAEPESAVFERLLAKIKSICMAHGFKVYGPSRLHLTICKVRSSRDPAVLQPIENMCTVSRFSGVETDVSLSLKPVGSLGDQELLDAQMAAPKHTEEEEWEDEKLVGCHIKEAFTLGGLHLAVYKAAAAGSRSCALFFQNQRTLEAPEPLTQEAVNNFKEACKKCDIPPSSIMPHGSYKINLGATGEKLEQTKERIVEDFGFCKALGIRLYNVHLGHVADDYGACVPEFLKRVADTINEIHEQTSETGVTLVLETGAGQNLEAGRTFEELRAVLDNVKDKSRIGICIDTCHIFQAGYDIRTPISYSRTMCEFDRIIGFEYLRAMHLNDAKAKFAQHTDRHEIIGRGHIGTEAFKLIMNDHRLDQIPLILETPYSPDNHLAEIQLLHKLSQPTSRQQTDWAPAENSGMDWLPTIDHNTFGLELEKNQPNQMHDLTEQIWNFYREHRQGEKTYERKERLRLKLQNIIENELGPCRLCAIGGTVNGLGSNKSDIDMTLLVPAIHGWQASVDALRRAQAAIDKSDQLDYKSDVRVGVIPILRLEVQEEHSLQVDISCNELVSVRDSHLLQGYTRLDERLAPLALVLKRWASDLGLNDALNGYLNNYSLVLLLLHYLQVGAKVVPNLQAQCPQLYSPDQDLPDDWHQTTPSDQKCSDGQSVAALLAQLFAYYSTFPFEYEWISIRLGARLCRDQMTEDQRKYLIFIEDPYECKNTSRCVLKPECLKKIRTSFRKACDLLQQRASLDNLFSV